MPYSIGGKEFKKKSDITSLCQVILAKTPDDTFVSKEYSEFLFELFRNHDEWGDKSKGGVRRIKAKMTSHGTRCFVLEKNLGDDIDISFPHSIKLIPTKRTAALTPQGLLDYKAAARTAVQTQIFGYRDKALKHAVECPYTGEVIDRTNCAIDHIPPNTFDQILFDFSVLELIDPLDVEVASKDGVVAEFVDKNITSAWQEYHRQYAKLRAISKTGNLQLSKVRVPWLDILG